MQVYRKVQYCAPLLFLIFINDIVTDIGSNIRLFADDTSLYIIVEHPDLAARCINFYLHTICDWAGKWRLSSIHQRVNPW